MFFARRRSLVWSVLACQESRRQGRPEAVQATHKTTPPDPADFLVVYMFDKTHVCNRNRVVLATLGASMKCVVIA